MDRINSIQIPINIIDNIVDDILHAFFATFHLLFFIGLAIMFGINNHIYMLIISLLFFCIACIIDPGITHLYSNARLIVNEDGIKIKKYGREILFISFDNLLGVRGMKHEMKSNTFFEMYLNYNEYQVVDYTTKNIQKVTIKKKNFKSANYYYDLVVNYFNSNPQLPQVWHQNIY